MILLDTSGLLAALDPEQPNHARCGPIVTSATVPLLLSPFVLAELDYMILKLGGVDRELELLGEVAGGAYQLVQFSTAEVGEAREVISRYRDLDIGLADASIVVLSRKYNELDLLTLDLRHFRALRGARGRPFRILP